MQGKKILIGITGSIAAYKIPHLVRLFIKNGAEVRVVMTPAARDFVSPLVLSTLSKHDVLIELFNENAWANHVMLGRWADMMLIAPASANTIAKMAQGLCDNLLLSVYLSATCPVMVCPAMDEDMWHHGSMKRNLDTLSSYGNIIVESKHGELASGLVGMGRMEEPEEIVTQVEQYFLRQQRLSGKKALITAGPTYENIDPVRFIGNHSSGKMGIAIANILLQEGCKVSLVLGPSNAKVPDHANLKITRVNSAAQMYEAALAEFADSDLAVMSAAVADYTPIQVAGEKIKKQEVGLTIELTKTKDILKALGQIKSERQILIGFALESNNEKEYALKKLREKNADAIVLNSLKNEGAGFAHDTNQITIFEKSGKETEYSLKSKLEVAKDIVHKIIELIP